MLDNIDQHICSVAADVEPQHGKTPLIVIVRSAPSSTRLLLGTPTSRTRCVPNGTSSLVNTPASDFTLPSMPVDSTTTLRESVDAAHPAAQARITTADTTAAHGGFMHQVSHDRRRGWRTQDNRHMPVYMVIERFKNGDPLPVYRRFNERGRLMPEGLTYVSSWVEPTLDRCYQVMEADDRALLDRWMSNWRDLVDFEVHEVITSAEAAERVAPQL